MEGYICQNLTAAPQHGYNRITTQLYSLWFHHLSISLFIMQRMRRIIGNNIIMDEYRYQLSKYPQWTTNIENVNRFVYIENDQIYYTNLSQYCSILVIYGCIISLF